MNWRVLTAINALIALITVGAVIFDLTRTGQGVRSRTENRQTSRQSGSAADQREPRDKQVHIESVEDLTNARVDDLGSVPAVALTELMRRATPEQLMAMALKFNEAPTDARTFGGMGVFFQAWTELDPKAAISGAFQMNDVGMRRLAARTVVWSASPHAAPELINFVKDHPDNDLKDECQGEFLGNLVSIWSQLDPGAASSYLDQLGEVKNDDGFLSHKARGDTAYNWATLDPSAALEWVAKQKNNDAVDSSDLYDNIIKGWARNDISSAAAYVRQHLDDPDIGNNVSSLVAAMVDHNLEEATDWVGKLSAGDPRDQAESKLISLWSAKDPASAAKWVASLPVQEQASLSRTITNYWMESNWQDASRWIATLTGDARDEALVAATNREAATQYDSLSVALSIGNEQTRNDVIERIIRGWAAADVSAAQAWVSGSPLSTEQRDHLRSVISEVQQNTAEVEHVIIAH
jgi:hypothetical protein